MSTELLVSIVAAASSLATAVLTNLFNRRSRQTTSDHTTVQTMEILIKNLRTELDRERAYRQELEHRVKVLESMIQKFHGDGK